MAAETANLGAEVVSTEASVADNQLNLLSTAKAGTETKSTGGSDVRQGDVTPKTDDVTYNKSLQNVEKRPNAKEEVALKSAVPEKYDFKIPEGVVLDEKVMTSVNDLFRNNGLTQEQAQAMMDFNLNTYKANQDELIQAHDNQKAEWKKETETAFGADYAKRMSVAAKARDAFASKELISLLVDSGLEHNVHVIGFFEKIGSKIGEDKFVEGGANGVNLSNLTSKERLEYHIRQTSENKNKT